MAKAQPKKTQSGNDFFFKIAKLKSGQKTAILIAFMLAVLGGFYYFYYQPYNDKLTQLNAEIAQLTETARAEQTVINKHKPIAEYIEPVANTFDFLSGYLTTEDEIPRLMQIISNLGAQSGVRVILFEPRLVADLKPTYAEIGFTMNLEGSFLNVVKFFYTMSQLQRIINIRTVTLDSPVMGENMTMIIKVKCVGSTYRLLTEDETKKVQT
ncbi:MAG: type 4a pilus biogenesis protein PilO [Deltaproteobacteria bacterium]|jgi:Tfp pilus assembly protein PilO|nr:type 4a pilus biogenesis protein PilO [Deltaproteobacteria bacterium]